MPDHDQPDPEFTRTLRELFDETNNRPLVRRRHVDVDEILRGCPKIITSGNTECLRPPVKRRRR